MVAPKRVRFWIGALRWLGAWIISLGVFLGQMLPTGCAYAATTYNVTFATASAPNPLCAGMLVIDLLSSDSWTNRLTITQFSHDGHLDTTVVAGGPVAGELVFGSVGGDTTTIDDAYFVNRLTIPFDTLGTYVSFDLTLTESGPNQPSVCDQVAVYFMKVGETSPQLTADPLGANALFAITATGQSGGLVEAFSPAVLQSGTTIDVDLQSFCVSGGGGCPFVDARTSQGWRVENSVLGRSATDALSLDAYRLKSPLRPVDGRVQVRIRENEQEFTTLDQVRLVAVDHPPDVRAFPIGDRIVLGIRVPAHRVTTSSGTDITELVSGSGVFYQAHPGDTILVDMRPPETAGLGVQSITDGGGPGDGEIDPKEMEAPQMKGRGAVPLGAVDEEILNSTGVLVQRPDGHGGWRTVVHHYPRQYRDDALFDSLGSGQVRLVFVGRHRLHFFGRILESSAQAVPQVLTLLSADHSRLGNAKPAVGESRDATTLLAPGDTLTLTFAAPPIPVGQVRDWFVLTRGVYSSASPLSHQPGSQERPLPTSFAMRQNRPNPFFGRTTIHFELPAQARVHLEIFDAQGRQVRTLADGAFPAGFHAVEWDHRDDRGQALGAGVYLYRIRAGSFQDQKKMVLLAR